MSTEQFPIIKIDRTTGQEMLPLFMNKGIFAKYKELPTKEDLLLKGKAELGKDSLTDEEEREILGSAAYYRTKNYIVRDYKKYVIGFGLNGFLNESNEALDNALGRISLYRLGHKIVTIILAEIYRQRKFIDLEISKERILEYLGYSTKDKQIYKQIDDVMFSLMTLNYFIYEYKTKVFKKLRTRELGYFIYKVKTDHKKYTVSVNENFVGCIIDILTNDPSNKKDFSRGYYDYPTALLPASKDYSNPAYLLANFLIIDSGNAKLNNSQKKVVAYSVQHLLAVMKIESKRPSEIKKALLGALGEVKALISSTSPSIKELSSMKPSRFMEQTIHFSMPRDIERLDESLKGNL
jgi:hypothetical protein